MRKPVAIVCSDLHLRDSAPINRVDDYWRAQETKFDYILSLDAPCIFCGGDLLDKWDCSPRVLSLAMKIKDSGHRMFTTVGQHELPYHNYDKMKLSGLHTLWLSDVLKYKQDQLNSFDSTFLKTIGWGELVANTQQIKYILYHVYVNHSNQSWVQQNGMQSRTPAGLFEMFPDAELIVTGDNHMPYTMYYKTQLLLNSGSMMRMTVAQKEHKPRVYLYYDDNTFDTIYLPINQNVFDEMSFEKDKNKDNPELRKYIEFQRSNVQDNVSFEDNLKEYMRTNKVSKTVEDIILNVLED